MKLTFMKNGLARLWRSDRDIRAPPSRRSRRRTGCRPRLLPSIGVSTYWPLILKSSFAGSPALPDSAPLVTLCEHRPQLRVHVREPGRVGVGVGVEMIEADILHLVVALRVGQRVVGLAEVPLAGEEGLVAARLEHRGQRPFGRRQAAALALERDRGHAAAVRDAAGLHRGPAGRAARLGVERQERHALVGQAVDIGRRHAAALAAAIGAEVAVAVIVGDDQEMFGFFSWAVAGPPPVNIAARANGDCGCQQPT